MTPTKRTDLIARVPNLTPEQAEQVAAALAPLIERLGGSLSATDWDDYGGHGMRTGRRVIVKRVQA